jgi:uncharacterized protein YkwD
MGTILRKRRQRERCDKKQEKELEKTKTNMKRGAKRNGISGRRVKSYFKTFKRQVIFLKEKITEEWKNTIGHREKRTLRHDICSLQ